MRVTRIAADVKIRPVFECGSCGTADEGSEYQSVDLDESSMEDFIDALRRTQPQSRCLPIGWSISGIGNYKCPECLKRGVS